MYRYVGLNQNSNLNSLNINKKPQKAAPISLLSGDNSFFVKIKSNQIASNYNDKNNKVKPNTFQKINNTYFPKDSKNKSLNKYLNNSQPKVSFLFKVNNSIEHRKVNNNNNISNNKSLINKTNQEIYTHNKGIYSFTSLKNNDKFNNKSINSTSIKKNYNEASISDLDHLKMNMNKITSNHEKKKQKMKIIKEKNDKNFNTNNVYNIKINQTKTLNVKHKVNNETLVKNEKILTDKNINLTITHQNKNNNQIKLARKNQNLTKNNNKNLVRYKNVSNILFNTNPNNDKMKPKNKNNDSERKNRVIFHGQMRNNKLLNFNNTNINSINNNSNIFIDNINETDEFNSSVSNRKIEKKIKSINIKPNKDSIGINTSKYNFNNNINDKSLLLLKKNEDKNTTINQHMCTKSNNIINNVPKLDIKQQENKLHLKYAISNLTNLNSKNIMKKGTTNIINDNINSINKFIDTNNEKDYKYQNKNHVSVLTSFNIGNNKLNNYPNIIINNNYLYNYMPFVTLNNSVNEDNINRLKLNRNSFFDTNYHINTTQNLPIEKILNHSNIIDNKINKEQKNKINKKNKNEQDKIKVNIIEENTQNNNHINNNNYNFHVKFISSNALDNINRNKTNRNNLNLHFYKESTNNNITDNYVSKEKNKKRKQNPPLNKNPKKLNILSLIQENSRKVKNNIRSKTNFPLYNNKDINYLTNKNELVTIEQIMYPNNDTLNNTEMFDNFDDMNTIVRRIIFEDVDLKKINIFTVENKYSENNLNNNWYEKFSENFNNMFDKKCSSKSQNMSSAKNKIKKSNYIYHSRQSGSTKASNKENSSTKKIRVSSYIGKRFEKSGIVNVNKNI